MIKNLENLTSKDLKEAKTYIEGHKTLRSEDPIKHCEDLSFWEFINDAKKCHQYTKEIQKVTLKQAKEAAKKYLNKNYTMIVLN